MRNGKVQYRVWRDLPESQIERERIGLDTMIQRAVFAALGCTTVDHRSPLKLDGAATQITRFVLQALTCRI